MTSGIIKVKKTRNYASILNKSIEDPRLSWKATGILCYLLSRPDDWQVRISDLCNRKNPINPKTDKPLRGDGENAVRNAIAELMHYGYIVRGKAIKNSNGTWGGIEYTVFEEPQDQQTSENTNVQPCAVEWDAVKRDAVNGQPNKTEFTNTDINNGPQKTKKKSWQQRKQEQMIKYNLATDKEYDEWVHVRKVIKDMNKNPAKYKDNDEIPF